MTNKQERTQRLEQLLQDTIRYMKDDCFDNEDKEFFFEQGVKILAALKDLNKAL